MTHIFGGIPCYARATAICSDVLLTTTTVTKTIYPTSTSTDSDSDSHNPQEVLRLTPQITNAPYVTTSSYRREGERLELELASMNPFDCPTRRDLGDRTDIHSACACLVGHGPIVLTVTLTTTAAPADKTSSSSSSSSSTPAQAQDPKPMPKKKSGPQRKKPATGHDAAFKKASVKAKAMLEAAAATVDVDAPLRKGVYGEREKDLRPYGKGAEPVPYWDKDDGFDHKGQ